MLENKNILEIFLFFIPQTTKMSRLIPDYDKASFANSLKSKRLSLGLSIDMFSKLLNVKTHNVYKWEEGTEVRDLPTYRNLCKFIDGFFDSAVKNGTVDYRKLLLLQDDDEESFVKEPQPDYKITKPLNSNVENALTTAIAAQQEALELLRNEVERLRAENEKLRAEYEDKNLSKQKSA